MKEIHANCFNCRRKLYILDTIYMCNYCNSPEWNKFFLIAEKHYEVKEVIRWFDTNIVQAISTNIQQSTLDVRIRIVCGMVNKLVFLTYELKYELMEMIWRKYKDKMRRYSDFVAISIHGVPFLFQVVVFDRTTTYYNMMPLCKA